ncbi:PEGA domain-containing protein [Acidipila sp. EB88]|nr:PEGA domain-containing protein [Acidipila sp. EB88]
MPFEVVEDVQVQGVTVIAKGATALATVTDAEHKKTMGRGGRLDLNVDSVRLVDNEKAQLRATAGGKAGGHTGAMTGAMVATGILFFPAAPLFLFIHGKDLTLPKGLETTAFVDGDMHLKLAALTAPAADTTRASAAAGMSQVSIDASVPNCDVLIDGAFAGNTPSELSLTSGKHEVTVRKHGYADWTRTLAASGTAVRLHAELEAQATQAVQK